MATQVLDLEFQLVLRALRSPLVQSSDPVTVSPIDYSNLTLKARCSRKWAVPLVSSVSAREPASIQTPTVEV